MTKAATVTPKTPKKVTEQSARPVQALVSSDDFVLLCPSAADSVLAQAALYFLPVNYKLRVLVETFQDIMPLSDDQTIVGRISFGSPKELTDDALTYDAIIYGSADLPYAPTVPRIVISKQIQPPLVRDHSGAFSVAPNSPEALASAMLRIARRIQD